MSFFKAPPSLEIPNAEKHPYTQNHHGYKTTDNYHWLRADNWQQALREPDKLPENIKRYLQDENAYCNSAMANIAPLKQQLITEMRGRIQEDETGVPDNCDGYAYNTRYEVGSEHPIMIRTPRDATDGNNDEEILLDGNLEAKGTDYFELDETEVSPDHKHLAWTFDDNGSEYFRLKIRDLTTGKDLNYSLADVGSVAWCDNQTLFYTHVDKHHRPSKILRHTLGTRQDDDIMVMEETDNRFFMSVERLLSGSYLLLSSGMNDQDEHWFIPTDTPDAKPQLIEPRQPGLEYSVDHQGDQFIIVTNADGAEDFKIVSTSVTQPQKDNWVDIVPHQQGRMILGIEVYQNWLIWMERENALPSIKIRHNNSDNSAKHEEQQVTFTEEAYSISIDSSLEYETDILRFRYSSPTTPTQIYDYNLKTKQRECRKETVIPSGHHPEDYITKRLIAISHDGAEVPVTILYHHTTSLEGTAPCLLYGYGSYGASMPAAFSANRLSLVDRGFIFAIAHVRGGQEKGRSWYEAAKFAGKPNTFDDFIAVAEHLIRKSYTCKGNIICQGDSAGGLLVGAVVNMRPELFAGGIADVPFVDVLNTILDDTLPLTPGEWSQWGNPIEDKQAYEWIASYSPYDNISTQDYPAMLVTAGVSDPRVTYWEPAKWVAKLRASKTDDNVLLLKTNMTSGHFGTTGRFAALKDTAQAYAFALKAVGSV